MNNFEEQDYSNEKISLGIWKKIIRLVFKQKKYVILMILFVFCLVALDVIYPLLNKYALNHYFSDNPDFSDKYYFIAAYGFIAVGYFVTVWGFIKMAGIVEVQVGYELRDEAFKNLQILPFSYYDKTPAGWIMARLTSDSRKLATIISWGLVDLLWGSLTMLGILVVMFILNWRLALIILILLPILFVVSMYFRKNFMGLS